MVRKMESKFKLHLSSSREIFKSPSTAFSSPMSATINKWTLKSLMASFTTEAKCYPAQRGTDECPTARVGKARSQQGWASHSLHTNWKNHLLPVSAALATSSHTVQTLLAGKLAGAPENYKMMNFAWTREIARVNYEPLFRHIGEEDITILNAQTYYEACQILASGFNAAHRARHSFRNWHWWDFMNKQNIPLSRGLWTPISQSSNKSTGWSSLRGHCSPCPNNMDREK